ncbi:hypothetical protein KMP13_09790 [Epibacterium ulvae]|nr:hypothetical protein [Epibacterium ulvae]
MTQNPWFCQLLANVLEREIAVAQMPDITAFSAAQMAARFCGVELPFAASQKTYRPETGFVPDPARFAEACAIAKAWP